MEKMVWLCNVRNEIEAGMVTGVLDNEGIPNRTFVRGTGAIHTSSRLFGAEIQVAQDALPRAKELLQAYFSPDAVLLEDGD